MGHLYPLMRSSFVSLSSDKTGKNLHEDLLRTLSAKREVLEAFPKRQALQLKHSNSSFAAVADDTLLGGW